MMGQIIEKSSHKRAVFGYGRKPEYYRWTTPLEYQLFASDKRPQMAGTGLPITRPTGLPRSLQPCRKQPTPQPPAPPCPW